MIEVSHVRKIYQNDIILRDVSFQVERGECLGIIGPNGSGKSTLLKLLSGVERADEGTILLDGKEIEQHARKDLARWLAVLQQETLPPVSFTVREVVEMGRFPYQNWLGEDERDADALVDLVLEKLGLTELQHRSMENLSGGERQRVALGKTMAQEPKLLMLDEPTTYLDIGHQVHLMNQIRAWRQESEMTVVAVLHDLNLAALHCDRILMLHSGEIVAIGTPEQMVRRELIEDVYGITPLIVQHPDNGLPQVILPGQVG